MRNIDNIENILCELNEEIDNYSAGLSHIRADFEMMTCFTYETAGNYSLIKFGEEILWDSENEPREWIEDDNDYEDLKTFIKREYNRYVNTLKRFRFSDVDNKDEGYKDSEAFDAADKIIEVIQKVKTLGHEWDILEEGTQDDIFQEIVTIIERYN